MAGKKKQQPKQVVALGDLVTPPAERVVLTEALLLRMFGKAKTERVKLFAPHLIAVCQENNIDTIDRIAAFLATVAEESGNLAKVREDLYYSAQRLAVVWPKRFAVNPAAKKTDKDYGLPNAKAAACAGQPEKLANEVYGGRNGNRPPSKDDDDIPDGFQYCGRGLIQITGRANYEAYAAAANRRANTLAAWLESPEGATRSAAWYWSSRNLNTVLRTHGFLGVSKVVNQGNVKASGAPVNMKERQGYFDQFSAILRFQLPPPAVAPTLLPKAIPAPFQKDRPGIEPGMFTMPPMGTIWRTG